ncbi:hypothetical protein KQI42_17140 [Tissierella sp. MSJ-40]|jgi:VIT1/CCC1 family predicted Fe2+/Mn2+ transporter|uniref:Glycine zipper-like domain-containing protein n=1 Tax=Tissierella simiarum TaxID=2841534 RepID=A0ABS6E9Y4_9FIRM|nr:hypothetical protein [Tissierella simiarum]MBU5439743.1 hypothetical protein [Tissierella simiarum]
MKKDTNKYLAISISLGLCFGAGVGIIIGIIMNKSNFISGIPLGAGLGMIIGIIVGSILDSNNKKIK